MATFRHGLPDEASAQVRATRETGTNELGRKAAELKQQGDRLGAKALHHPWMLPLARMGCLAKGVV